MEQYQKELYDFIMNKKHHKFRKVMRLEFERGMSPIERMTFRFEEMCKAETPVILENEQICFLRTIKNIPDIFSENEWAEIKKNHYIHERGYMSNLSPDYERVISEGLLKCKETADEYGRRAIDAILNLTRRYKDEAEKQGREDLVEVLTNVPGKGAVTFREALQSFRIIHYALWLEGNYHNTIGRFDKYMYPYLKKDLEKGEITEKQAYDLMIDFFLSFNKDSDTYVGVQQGDNGQSMVLGGMDENGEEVFNLLSEMCLRASEELRMIDPKINLRVSKNTPIEVYELGSRLTRVGLGFPQYSNDDVVIEGLKKAGYAEKDARDYVVAACWEFIIPRVGGDVANIAALSFPKVIDTCLHRDLKKCAAYETFETCVKVEIQKSCNEICDNIKNLWFVPSPFMNVMMDCVIYDGGKYNNLGIHGSGIATAADSLEVIRKYIFEEKSISAQELIEAVDSDFEQHMELLPKFRFETPKLGNDIEEVDELAVKLLDWFADSLEGKKNCRDGIFRAGTGTAMYYLWHAQELGASPDGRRKGEAFGTNFSPSLFARMNGPFSVIKSFTKPHFERAINGGPLTLEFHNGMFRDSDSIAKIAMLVKTFIDMGGHQLQLNAVNMEAMKDAQIHPENHRQLVVRIWGWSAYFVELDKEYQDHVMKRQEYVV